MLRIIHLKRACFHVWGEHDALNDTAIHLYLATVADFLGLVGRNLSALPSLRTVKWYFKLP